MSIDPLAELKREYTDVKIHHNEEYDTYIILDQRKTPFWTAFFRSELDAMIAWDYYQIEIKRLVAEKEDMKRRNHELRKERHEILKRYLPGLYTGGPNVD